MKDWRQKSMYKEAVVNNSTALFMVCGNRNNFYTPVYCESLKILNTYLHFYYSVALAISAEDKQNNDKKNLTGLWQNCKFRQEKKLVSFVFCLLCI